METVTIEVGGKQLAFELDLGNGEWTCATDIDEAAFPLLTVLDGLRYELYSDGTMGEEIPR